jgi:hypothetical protein
MQDNGKRGQVAPEVFLLFSPAIFAGITPPGTRSSGRFT